MTRTRMSLSVVLSCTRPPESPTTPQWPAACQHRAVLTFARRLLPLLDGRTRRRLGWASAAMVVLALLEGLALLALTPLLEMLAAPDLDANTRMVQIASDLFGNPSPEDLAITLG